MTASSRQEAAGARQSAPEASSGPRVARAAQRPPRGRTGRQALSAPGRPVGIPPGCRIVTAQPDTIPVEFDAPRCCYAAWLDEDLMRQTETRPPRRPPRPPAATTAEPEPDEPDGQLAFAA